MIILVKVTLRFPKPVRIAYFGRKAGVVEKNGAATSFLSYCQGDSENFTFEIAEKAAL